MRTALYGYALAAHESSLRVKWLKSLLAAYPARDPALLLPSNPVNSLS